MRFDRGFDLIPFIYQFGFKYVQCITIKNFPKSLYSNSKVIAVVPWQNIFAIFSAQRNAGIFIVLTHFVLMFYKKIHLICKMYIQVV